MNLDELRNEWKKDSIITSNYDLESRRTSELHSKYINYLSIFMRESSLRKISKTALERELRKYYLGHSTPKDLEMLGKNQWNKNAIKAETALEKAVSSDICMLNLEKKYDELDIKINFILEVIKQINGRNYSIKNAIDYLKWSQPG